MIRQFYLLAIALVFSFSACSQKKDLKPNVVFILVDDLGWTDLGVMGSKYYQTPNVDALAQSGVLFTDAYSACTVCSPSRASIMTGKYPATINCTDWIEGWKMPRAKLKVPEWTMYMSQEEFTMAEAFKENGYKTGHIGKWHLGEEEKYWPENHGFDENIGGWKKGAPNRNKKKGSKGYFAPFGNPRLKDKPTDEYLTERLADEACGFIERNNPEKTGKPFFLNYWLYSVHTPLQAKKDKIKKYKGLVDTTYQQKNPVYAAMVEHMDEAVGKVLNKLKEHGLDKNTIVVFTSDNGGLVGKKKKSRGITSNLPLKHGKGHMYEGAVRVPLIVFNPKQTKKVEGKVNTPVVSADFYPTLVDMLGLSVKPEVKKAFDGISIAPMLSGQKTEDRDVFWHYPHYHIEGAKPYSAIRSGDWKLIRFFEDDHYELYNLKDDIGEANDLAEAKPEKVELLKKKLFAWYDKVGAQMPTENPNYDPENWNKRK